MTPSIVEGRVLPCFDPLWVSGERLRAPHPGLVIDGAEGMVNEDLERSEIDLHFAGLRRVPWGWFVDCTRSSVLVLRESNLRLWLLPLASSFGCNPGRILDLDVFVDLKQDVIHIVTSCFTKCL